MHPLVRSLMAISLERRFRIIVLFVFGVLTLGLATRVNGATTSYTYDSLNRLTKAIYPDATVITYTYDAAGNRSSQVISSADANLTSLVPSAGNLAPVFASGTTDYTAIVPSVSASITV